MVCVTHGDGCSRRRTRGGGGLGLGTQKVVNFGPPKDAGGSWRVEEHLGPRDTVGAWGCCRGPGLDRGHRAPWGTHKGHLWAEQRRPRNTERGERDPGQVRGLTGSVDVPRAQVMAVYATPHTGDGRGRFQPQEGVVSPSWTSEV